MSKIEKIKSKYGYIILGIIIIILLLVSIFNLMSSTNKSNEKTVEYSEYSCVKDRINDYNTVYSKNSGYNNSSILLVEDATDVILMITLPRISDGGKDVAIVNFTNMEMSNTSYDKYNNPIIECKMDITSDFTIKNANTHNYHPLRDRTYSKYDSEWNQIQNIASGVGNGLTAIIKGINNKDIDIYRKTIQELKSEEYSIENK